ncbi:hypothetical protein C493_17851 [Natronolimnohabitans innermongolicus JCM 12255]|uniref:Dodecin n=2 Tax=Natronolimnohabitans innermongolicus TaxID=253107 RepID=L9WNX1_9EURY|nr:hypothetical protein C493_17851 [Natronolimnohabitans innermongolicus JCM 12255]
MDGVSYTADRRNDSGGDGHLNLERESISSGWHSHAQSLLRSETWTQWTMGETVKVITLTGNSTESWEDAAENALDDADETLENITGIEVESQTAEVDDGTIEEYRTTLDVAFVLNR